MHAYKKKLVYVLLLKQEYDSLFRNFSLIRNFSHLFVYCPSFFVYRRNQISLFIFLLFVAGAKSLFIVIFIVAGVKSHCLSFYSSSEHISFCILQVKAFRSTRFPSVNQTRYSKDNDQKDECKT